MATDSIDSSDRELLIKILRMLETQAKNLTTASVNKSRVYDNKALMSLLNIKDKYLKRLRVNGYLGYSRVGDKYWYTQEDVNLFLRRFHYEPYASAGLFPM